MTNTTAAADYQLFDAGTVPLQSGESFAGLQLAYKTYGTLNAARDNVIVYPTSFSAQHYDTEWAAAPGGILDTDRYFVIISNLIGNGLSSSPSNSTDRYPLNAFPAVSYFDAVAVQRRLLHDVFGIERVALVYGWSMGAMQAYHWAAHHGDMVDKIAVVCGSARCSPFNRVFLESVKAALTADAAFQDGAFVAPPRAGYRAMGRVYAGWVLSHTFYRDELWRQYGCQSLEEFLVTTWDTNYARRDANDLLAQLRIWGDGDISRGERFGGDLERAMAAITADVLLMPGETDAYFQARDNEAEMPMLVNARSATLRPIPSVYGHRAGNPHNIPADRAFLKATLDSFMGGVAVGA